MKFDNYQPRRLLWPVSQIDVQRIMLGFLVEGHTCARGKVISLSLLSSSSLAKIAISRDIGISASGQCCQDVINGNKVMSLCFDAFDKGHKCYKLCFFNGHAYRPHLVMP